SAFRARPRGRRPVPPIEESALAALGWLGARDHLGVKGSARGALRQREVRELPLRRALRVIHVREQHEAVRESPQDQRIDESEDETDDTDRDGDAGEDRY